MKHFINLKDISSKDLKKILTDAKKRKSVRKKLNNLEAIPVRINIATKTRNIAAI